MNQQEILQERNNNKTFGTWIGVETVEVEEGYAQTKLNIRPEHVNSHGAVHGGCLYTLADCAAGAASKMRGKGTVTLSGDLKFFLPAANCLSLMAIAKEIKHGRYVSVYEVKIYDNMRRFIASGVFEFFLEQNSFTAMD